MITIGCDAGSWDEHRYDGHEWCVIVASFDRLDEERDVYRFMSRDERVAACVRKALDDEPRRSSDGLYQCRFQVYPPFRRVALDGRSFVRFAAAAVP